MYLKVLQSFQVNSGRQFFSQISPPDESVGCENPAYVSSSNEDDPSTSDDDHEDDHNFDKEEEKPILTKNHVTIQKEGEKKGRDEQKEGSKAKKESDKKKGNEKKEGNEENEGKAKT